MKIKAPKIPVEIRDAAIEKARQILFGTDPADDLYTILSEQIEQDKCPYCNDEGLLCSNCYRPNYSDDLIEESSIQTIERNNKEKKDVE